MAAVLLRKYLNEHLTNESLSLVNPLFALDVSEKSRVNMSQTAGRGTTMGRGNRM